LVDVSQAEVELGDPHAPDVVFTESVGDGRPPIQRSHRDIAKLSPEKVASALVTFGFEEPLRQDDTGMAPDTILTNLLFAEEISHCTQLAIQSLARRFLV
jgi:hypothetical protein